MSEQIPARLPIAVRVWTENDEDGRQASSQGRSQSTTKRKRDRQHAGRVSASPPRWRSSVLIFDTETTIDPTQQFTFGIYRYARWRDDGTLSVLAEGIVYADDLPVRDAAGFGVLTQVAASAHADVAIHSEARTAIRLLSHREFVNDVLWPAIQAEALIVGFNLPFDLSRLAVDVAPARGSFEGGFSFVLWDYLDAAMGEWKENKYRPRLRIQQIDSKRSRYDLTRPKDWKGPKPKPGFLDLRTLAYALSDCGHSLLSAGKAFGARQIKAPHAEGHGVITPEYVAYARQDVAATCALLEALRAEFDRHPLDLDPSRTLSPASIAKAYLRAMVLVPILERQPDFSREVLGWSMNAYYGGRAECGIRRTPVPIVYTDVLSMYPTVNALLGLWAWHIAEHLEIEDCTAEAQALLDQVSPEMVLDPTRWPEFAFFAQLIPDRDVLPVRAPYAGKDGVSNIGVNVYSDTVPQWYAGPDLVASALLGDTRPQITRAFRIGPKGRQAGLRSVSLRGSVTIDPEAGDFFQTAIEERQRLKHRNDISAEERDRLRNGLKVVANSGAYGITVESLPKQLPAGKTAEVIVYGPEETPFAARTPRPEMPGEFSFPPAAALVTAGARLILALIERMVTDLRGSYAFCDTDSMAIVATKDGGLVPCPGGAHRLLDGREAIRALSWADVDEVVARLAALNPYDPAVVPGSILKIEDVNFDPTTKQRRQLWCLSIAAKRYTLFYLDEAGKPVIPKGGYKRHGLGFLLDPSDPIEEPDDDEEDNAAVIDDADEESERARWERALWEGIVHDALGLPWEPPNWRERPAVTRLTISSPWHLRAFARFNAGKPYAEQVKPFNFLLAAHLANLGRPSGVGPGDAFRLIAPFEIDPRKWARMPWVDIYSGQSHQVTTQFPGGGRGVAGVSSLDAVAAAYPFHPEAKRSGPDGKACGKQTDGLLQRRVIEGAGTICIGKEAHRLEDRGLVATLDEVLTTYADRRRDPWIVKVLPRLREIAAEVGGRDRLMEVSGLSERALRDVLTGRSRPRESARTALASAASCPS